MKKTSLLGCVAGSMLLAFALLPATTTPGYGQQAEEDEFEGLAAGVGQEEVLIYCSACHSTRIVQQQGMSRDDWAETLEWMVEEQGMGEIDEPDLSLILDYLAKHYNVDRPNFPSN
ncbi:hypothetical protein A9Q97_01325 [Rhodospirillales bacterium 47_12_T64]|nr:hypothetical protein A9Q97_01325 [Rhodospirillales bacterium 47_12_T64]